MEGLEDYVEREGLKKCWKKTKEYFFESKETINKVRSYGLARLFFVAYCANEFLQHLATTGKIDYQTFMGYGSAVTGPAFLTAVGLGLFSKAKVNLQRFVAIAPAITCTLHEFFPIDPACKTFDPLDIPYYFLGSALAYGGVRLVSTENLKEKTRNTMKKLNPFKKSKKYLGGNRLNSGEAK